MNLSKGKIYQIKFQTAFVPILKCVWTATQFILSLFSLLPTCVFKSLLKLCARGIFTWVAFVWFFSSKYFQVCSQSACLGRGIVALVAFVRLFSTVRFEMSPQNVCPRRGILTLVAFVWLFSTVRFEMCLQSISSRRCKVTLVAIVRGIVNCARHCELCAQNCVKRLWQEIS